MKKTLITTLLAFGTLCTSQLSQAEDLVQVYQQALTSDPLYQAQKAQYRADIEALPQSIAVLLPDIAGDGDYSGNYQKNHEGSALTGGGKGTFRFNSRGLGLDASQSIFDFGKWSAVAQAHATVKNAAAILEADKQDLMIRVSTAYFNVLEAQDNLKFAEAEKRAFKRQLDQAEQKYKVGLSAITDVYNARANYDGSIAQVIADQNDINNSKESLRRITGIYYKHLTPLANRLRLITPKPNNVEAWVATAKKQNFSLLASEFAEEEAKQEVHIAQSGHLPTVDAVADAGRDVQGNNGFGRQDTTSGTVGLQLNIPIFEGGLVMSQVRQATAEYEKSQDDYVDSYRSVINDTRQSFNDVDSGISKIRADRQTIVSSRSSLNSTEEGFKVGTRTIIDVLDQQQQLTQSQQIHSQDQYSYIIDILKLKEAAGTLNYKDIAEVNTWLNHTGKSMPRHKRGRARVKKTSYPVKVGAPRKASGKTTQSKRPTTTNHKQSAQQKPATVAHKSQQAVLPPPATSANVNTSNNVQLEKPFSDATSNTDNDMTTSSATRPVATGSTGAQTAMASYAGTQVAQNKSPQPLHGQVDIALAG